MPKGVKGFAKGQSGNPGGRAKRTVEEIDLIAACKAKTPAALDTVESIMINGESEKNRLSAAQYIIDRAYGKAIQQTELTGKDGENLFTGIQISFVKPSGSEG
jgi:hypothetical protein